MPFTCIFIFTFAIGFVKSGCKIKIVLHENWNILGMIIGSIGGISYLLDTIKGRARPNRVSWFLWGLAPLIAFFAEISEGVKLVSLLTLTVGVYPALVFLASFTNKKSMWKISMFDYLCGSFSVLGIILWAVTRQGTIAIFFSILADAMASVPTVLKSYKHPESETSLVYLLGIFQAVITLLTITTWDLSNSGFPIYILLMDSLIFSLIRLRSGKK
jgi:hypothetical protein